MSRIRSLKLTAHGLTLGQTVLAVTIAVGLIAAAVPAIPRALQSRAVDRLADDGKTLFRATVRFQADHGHPPYPGAAHDEGLNLNTLSPLTTSGYLNGAERLLSHLTDRQLLAYDAPGLPGREGFWMILVDVQRPEIQVLVASTDQFPLAPDTFLEGVYLIRGTTLEKLADAPTPVPRAAQRSEPRHG